MFSVIGMDILGNIMLRKPCCMLECALSRTREDGPFAPPAYFPRIMTRIVALMRVSHMQGRAILRRLVVVAIWTCSIPMCTVCGFNSLAV